MHEAAFSQAARPTPVQVMGLNLRPYSIGHELCLVREQSALANNRTGNRITAAMVNDLPMAALFCSQTWTQIGAMNRDPWISLKLWLWKRRLLRMKLQDQLAVFLEYQTLGSLEFPGEPPYSARPQRPQGTPELLRLHAFTWLQLGKGEIGAWDFPLGLAKMYYAGHLEAEGVWNVRGEYEEEYDKARDEWMAKNPGDTLKKVPQDA